MRDAPTCHRCGRPLLESEKGLCVNCSGGNNQQRREVREVDQHSFGRRLARGFRLLELGGDGLW